MGRSPSSTSPIRRNRRSPTWPSRTTETLLMPVPPSGGSVGTGPRSGQQHVEVDLVDREPVAGREAESDRGPWTGQLSQPGGIAGPRAAHPRLEDAVHAISREQQRQARRRDPRAGGRGSRHRSDDPTAGCVGPGRRAAHPGSARRRRGGGRHAIPRRGWRPPARRRGSRPARSQPAEPRRRRRRPPTATISASKAARWAVGCRCARAPDASRRSPDRARRRRVGRPSSSRRSSRAPVRRHHVSATKPDRCRRPRPPTSNGGSSVTLANGRLAAPSTTPTRIRRMTHPGAAAIDPDDPGRADHDRNAAGQGDQPGRHRRCHERHDDEVDERRQDREPPERDEDDRQRRGLRRERDAEALRQPAGAVGRDRLARSTPVSGVAHAISPAVASDDSWNPASPIRAGSETSRSVAAQPRAAVARPARPLSRASSTTPAISAARTTDGDAPAKAT